MGNSAPHGLPDPEQATGGPRETEQLLQQDAKAATKLSYLGTGCSAAADDDDQMLTPTPDGYYPHLDIWRFMCIAVVVLDHGDGRYSEYNLFFGQSWALQYIFVICGLAFGLSRKGIGGYVSRLAAYFVVGVLCNWLAYVIAGKDWRHDIWNVVFQFWFIVALIGYTLLLVPLKRFLAACGARREGLGPEAPGVDRAISEVLTESLAGLAVVGAGLVILWLVLSEFLAWALDGALAPQLAAFEEHMGGGIVYWAGGPEKAGSLLRGICGALELTLSNVWIATSVPKLFPREQSITGWILVINMHIRRLFLWYSGLGEKLMNGLDLMMLGLVCYHLGLKGRRCLGAVLYRYWFVWLAVCGLVWIPGTAGRLDLLMPEAWRLRWRMQLIDMIYLVVFLAAGDRFVDPMIFRQDRCNFINNLGLFLFLVHKAIHIVLPQPWNWLLILSMFPTFWLISKIRK